MSRGAVERRIGGRFDDKVAAIQSAAIRKAADPRVFGKQQARLYIDLAVLLPGAMLGPQLPGDREKRDVRQPSVLVFADPDPMANFGHDCRYWLFDPKSGRLLEDYPARFPPYVTKQPKTYCLFWERSSGPAFDEFEQPRGLVGGGLEAGGSGLTMPLEGMASDTSGRRKHAILYAGNPEPCHLNDLEFCYRTLVDKCSFSDADIHVVNFNGTFTCSEWGGLPPQDWPGKSAPGDAFYRLWFHSNTRAASRDDVRDALTQIRSNLSSGDMLFVFTTGHGDNLVPATGAPGESYLMMSAEGGRYLASDFASDLGKLSIRPRGHKQQFSDLVVVMQQCASGGFRESILNCGCARNISFASAASSTERSYKAGGLEWNHFSRAWMSALNRADPWGVVPTNPPVDATDPGEQPDHKTSAREAYQYASSPSVRHPDDSPRYGSLSDGNALPVILAAPVLAQNQGNNLVQQTQALPGTWSDADKIQFV